MMKNTLFAFLLACGWLTSALCQDTPLELILPNLNLGCIDDLKALPPPQPDKVDFLSTCEPRSAKVRHINDLIIERPCRHELHRIFAAEDACKNRVRDTQIIFFQVYEELTDVTTYIDLGCNPDLEAIPDAKGFQPMDCFKAEWLGDTRDQNKCFYSLTRKFKIFGECGISYILTQIYNWIEDLEPPKIQCPDDVHFGCNYTGIPPADPSQVNADDNCCLDSVYWGGDIIVSNPDTCEHTLIRRYWAVDCCGNTAYCDQTFNWYSFPAPPNIISCPPGADLGCNINFPVDIPAATPELVEVEKTCGDVTVTPHMSDITIFGCEYSVSWVYVVEDECGNISQCLQTFTWVVDEEPPMVIHCPSDLDLGCNPEPADFDIVSPDYGIEAEDNCGIANIKRVRSTEINDGDDCTKYYYIIYEIKDHCGNTAECKQKVFWTEDTVAPIIIGPDTLDLGCNPIGGFPDPDVSQFNVKENCCLDEIIWMEDMHFFTELPSPDCRYFLNRYYKAIDCCGNESVFAQHIIIKIDSTAPVIVQCPEGAELGCNIDPSTDLPAAVPEDLLFMDDCSKVTISHALSDITVFDCQFSITRVYTVTDACGNSSQCFQTFTWVVDEEPPMVIHCPSDLDLGCNPDPADFDIVSPDYGIEAEDNCGIASIKRVRSTEVNDGDDCTKYYYIVYEIKDHCGNTAECKQKVFWTEDKIPPTISCPPNLDMGCDPEEIPEPDPSILNAEDNCCLESVKMTASSISQENGFFKITRTYVATDCCGNIASCDQEITWRERPSISNYIACPADVDFGCVRIDPDIPAPIEDTPYGGEECPSLFTHAGDNIVQINPCEYQLTRTYLFISCCGDTIPCFQNFTWQWVNTDSVIPIPEDMVSFCTIPPLPDFVQDGLCGPGVPIYVGQTIIGNCADGNCTVLREWHSKGCLGSLFISDVQTIDVVCQFAPVQQLGDKPKPLPDFTIYPNPAEDMISLDFINEIIDEGLLIINAQGQIVKEVDIVEHTSTIDINISEMPSGIYFIRTVQDQRIGKRFVKL